MAAGAPASTPKQQKEIARQDPQRLTWKLHSMTYFHPLAALPARETGRIVTEPTAKSSKEEREKGCGGDNPQLLHHFLFSSSPFSFCIFLERETGSSGQSLGQ